MVVGHLEMKTEARLTGHRAIRTGIFEADPENGQDYG